MKRTALLALIVIVALTGYLLVELRHLVVEIIPGFPPAQRLEYYKLSVEIFKAIVVGFGVALFGILFPAILTETRASFERLKESRVAYSEAKTAGDYLALRVATMDLKGAVATVQRAHVAKHLAELYPELKLHLERRGISKTPEQWGDGLYNQYFNIRRVLETNAAQWDAMSADARLSKIRDVVASPKKEQVVADAVDPLLPTSLSSGA